MKLGKHWLSYNMEKNEDRKSKFPKFPFGYRPQHTGVIICGTYKWCYISCSVYFFYSRALFSPSLLPKHRDCAKTRRINGSSDVLHNPWPSHSGQLWSIPRWLGPLLTPERRSRQRPLCPSVHTRVWNDIPLYVSHSHLCLRVRHSSNFLPWNQLQSNREGRLRPWQWPRGADADLTPCTRYWAAAVFQEELPCPLLQPDSLSLADVATSLSRAESSLS